MKYRVVGWTDYDGDDVPDSGSRIGYAESQAIIDEIKKQGYLFSGWEHQEGFRTVPVLNDGKKRCFSQRGWGGIMAVAHGYTQPYDYARFTFYESIDGAKVKKPQVGFHASSFIPETDLAEHFTLDVDVPTFRDAQENNPFHLPNAHALRYIHAGDTLTLRSGDSTRTYSVTDIDRTFPSPLEKESNAPIQIIVTYRKGVEGIQIK